MTTDTELRALEIRLRQRAQASEDYQSGIHYAGDDAALDRKAAETISSLSKEKAELERQLAGMVVHVENLSAFIKGETSRSTWEDDHNVYEADIDVQRYNERPASPAAKGRTMQYILDEISVERRRQIEKEGWTEEHDDEHGNGEMARAAAAYADHSARFRDAGQHGSLYAIKAPHPYWPWSREWWKPKNPRRDLIRAAALIVAEIERLDRKPSGG